MLDYILLVFLVAIACISSVNLLGKMIEMSFLSGVTKIAFSLK